MTLQNSSCSDREYIELGVHMSGYDIADVPNIELSDSEKDLLESLGADATQSVLMSEAIIAVD